MSARRDEPVTVTGIGRTPAAGSPGASTLHRVNRAFGPIAAGMIIDLIDLATFGPIGLFVGLPVGALAGYWLGTCLGLTRPACVGCAVAAAVYCTLPFTEVLPLGTLAGAYARFMDSGRTAARADALDDGTEAAERPDDASGD